MTFDGASAISCRIWIDEIRELQQLLKMTVLKIRTGRRWPKLVDVVTGLSVAAVLLLLTYAGLQGEIALSQLDALGVTPIY